MLTLQEKTVAALVSGMFPDSAAFDFRAPLRYSSDNHLHIVVVGTGRWAEAWVKMAILVCHYPNYERRRDLRTRITWAGVERPEVEEFVYEHRELFDNCRWRTVDLRDKDIDIDMHRPMYEGRRKDFVDVEVEFVLGRFTHPALQQKLAKWESDPERQLTLVFCGDDRERNMRYASHALARHPVGAPPVQFFALGDKCDEVCPGIRVFDVPVDIDARFERMMDMAKYLNYFYNASYELKHVPTELPREDVEKAWECVMSPQMRLSNLFNILTIATKMRTLGHSRDDWQTFYALTASEIEEMTPTEHNRWSVERLLQGSRPCTDSERLEIEKDISLKKKYKKERNAHYDLVAFDELGEDETGRNVARYDSDLIAAIPLIVKSFTDENDE
ncbi:MAG: hypothetical protein K2M06_02980 [Muribaculaceae bacterium]|nr:hypothetical protein [Muribaculaceae bacterium]